jgi:arylsulfatase A-like enzyme
MFAFLFAALGLLAPKMNSCAPSRASFLTGRLPFHLAATRANLIPFSLPDGTNITYTMLPMKLAPAGVISHHIGKWHQGFHNIEYTPAGRGFNSSFGFLQGGEDHWTSRGGVNCGAPGSGGAARPVDLCFGTNNGNGTVHAVWQ